jgi:hypothetical protein
MKKYTIPEKNSDVRSYAIRKNLKYICCYLLYVAFFLVAFLSFCLRRHEDAEPLSLWVYLLFPVIVLVSGWFVCLMNRFVTDRYVCGQITGTKYTRDYGRGLDRKAGLSIDFHTYVKIEVKDGRGKKRRVKVPLFADGFDGYYAEGDELIKFRGLNYPLVKESMKKGVLLCTVCGVRTFVREIEVDGAVSPKKVGDRYFCRSCNHSLIEKF